jgi:hypothetical protein
MIKINPKGRGLFSDKIHENRKNNAGTAKPAVEGCSLTKFSPVSISIEDQI